MTAFSMLSWELLARHRRVFSILAIYFLLICLVCPLLPQTWRGPNLALPLVFLPAGFLILLVASLAHAYGDRLESRSSTFPTRLFTLPVSSLVLAAAPLLTGTLICVVCWPMLTLSVFWPCEVDAPLIWPALLGAAILASTQALSWSPFPVVWLRAVVASIVVPGLAFGSLALSQTSSEPLMAGVLAALTLLAYAVAITGVARARRGAGTAEARVTSPGHESDRYTPFISSASAHLWLEWRLRRWGFLITSPLLLAGGVTATHMSSIVLTRGEILPVLPHLAAAVEQYGIGWLSLTGLLLTPFILALIGADLGQFSSRGTAGVQTFFLTLPARTTTLVRYKFTFAALVVAVAWLLSLSAGLVWAAVTGHLPDMTDRLIDSSGSRSAALLLALIVPLLAMVVSWLWVVSGLWAGLPGKAAITPLPIVIGVAQITLAVCALCAWRNSPEIRPWISAALGLALLLKVMAVTCVAQRLIVRRLAGPMALLVCVAGWALLAAVVAGLVLPFTRGGPEMAAGVLLMLPLARPLAAPLVLDWVRQR